MRAQLLALLSLLFYFIAPNVLCEVEETVQSYRIRQVRFEGNEHLNNPTLETRFGLQEGRTYTRAEIVAGFERLRAAYQKEGFVFAEITPEVTSVAKAQVSLTAKIVEGKRLRTGAITIHWHPTHAVPISEDDIRRALGLREGQLFAESALARGIENIQMLSSEHGYPKIEVEPTDFQFSSEKGTVDFQLHIREGALIRIGEVKVSGLQKTKEAVVLREISLKPDERFDQRKIDASYRRLRNLGYFYQLNPNVLEAGESDDTVNFHARVTEARTGRLSGVIGYAPPDSDTDTAPRLTGVLEARETNLLGTGRHVNFYWKTGLRSTLRLGYEEPWILGKPIAIGVEYAQLQQRNPMTELTEAASDERSASLSGKTDFGSVFEGALTLGYKRINIPESGFPIGTPLDSQLGGATSAVTPVSDLGFSAREAYQGTKYSLTLQLTRDSRDYFLNPTRGRRDSIAFEISRSDFRLRKVWLSLQQYFPTWQHQTVAIELHGAAAWGTNIPATELFYLGGANTLRGYDEDWFSGPRRVHGTLEYRFLVGQASQVFAFTDVGAVTLTERPSVFDKLRVGYGLGVRLESKGGILRLDYGLAAGESALRGKIHINLGAAF